MRETLGITVSTNQQDQIEIYYCFIPILGASACPQRGCYDCPNYAPGENPFFKMKHKKAEHIRATDFIASGSAHQWRKVAEI